MSSSSSPIELTILSVKPQDSHVQEKLGIAHSIISRPSCCFPYVREKKGPSFTLSFNLVKVQD